MADLITRARALRNLNFLSTSADEDTLLDNLVSAASRAIENYCWRTFAVQDYDELYPGSGGSELFLRSYPITRIDRVACDPAPVIRATNTSSSVQRASVQVAAKTIQPQAMTWVIVGDLSKIEAGIRALDIGEVKVIDADGKILR